jgi:sec-independent protein translocase protein TatB
VIEGPEFLVILLVALIVLGPQRLPEVTRKMGRWMREVRAAARELQKGLEAEVGDVRSLKDELRAPLQDVEKAVGDTRRLVEEAGRPWVGPKPVTGPTPEDAMRDLAEIEETGQPATDRSEAGE